MQYLSLPSSSCVLVEGINRWNHAIHICIGLCHRAEASLQILYLSLPHSLIYLYSSVCAIVRSFLSSCCVMLLYTFYVILFCALPGNENLCSCMLEVCRILKFSWCNVAHILLFFALIIKGKSIALRFVRLHFAVFY